jgi:histidinol phosphatase-like PHP family hydrolase
MKYGVWQARRGWIEKGDVINTLKYEDFFKAIKR